MTQPRYDRIVPLVGLVLLGMGIIFILESRPESILTARFWGDLPTLSVAWILIGALVVIVSTAADLLARSHPQMQHKPLPVIRLGFIEFEIAPAFWVLPSLTLVSAFSFFRLFRYEGQLASLGLSLVAVGGLLTAVLVGQHYSLDRRPEIRDRALMVLHGTAYLAAFALFSAIYHHQLRTLYAAPLVFVSAALLSYEILQRVRQRSRLLLALLIGLTLAQVLWALNYWAAPTFIGGTMLLAVFYSVVGVLLHYQAGTLSRRLIWEFGSLGTVIFVILAVAMLYLVPRQLP